MTNVLSMIEDFLADVPDDPERVSIVILLPYMDAPHLFNVMRADVAEAGEAFKQVMLKDGVKPDMFATNAARSITAVTLMREQEGFGSMVGPLHVLMESANCSPEELAGYRYAAFIGMADQTLSGGDITYDAFMKEIRPVVENWGPVMSREAAAQRVGLPLDKLYAGPNGDMPPTLH